MARGQIQDQSVRLKLSIGLRAVAEAICGLALWLHVWPAVADERYGAPPSDLRLHLDRLVRSYPDWIARADDDNVVLKNDARLPVSDHRTDKSFDELVEHPDIDDMFYVPYPTGSLPQPPDKNVDPGRVRFEPLFVAMYGDCKRNEVARKMRAVDWLPAHHGGKVTITTANGIDKALDAASLDVNTAFSDYWRWAPHPAEPAWKNRIPVEVVRVFEKHGFIWGGAWYHYDTMHFEYRPELLPAAAGEAR